MFRHNCLHGLRNPASEPELFERDADVCRCGALFCFHSLFDVIALYWKFHASIQALHCNIGDVFTRRNVIGDSTSAFCYVVTDDVAYGFGVKADVTSHAAMVLLYHWAQRCLGVRNKSSPSWSFGCVRGNCVWKEKLKPVAPRGCSGGQRWASWYGWL